MSDYIGWCQIYLWGGGGGKTEKSRDCPHITVVHVQGSLTGISCLLPFLNKQTSAYDEKRARYI